MTGTDARVSNDSTRAKEEPQPETPGHLEILKTVLAATAPPLVAFALQSLFWPFLSPFAWILFFPAVFVASWIGGRASGIGATLVSTALATWYFVPPERTLAVETRLLPAVGVFMAMGFTFSVFHERLRRAHRDAAAALTATQIANDALKRAGDERRIFGALIENSSDFIGIADPNGKPVYLNPAGRRMIGLSAEFPVAEIEIQDCYPKELRPFVNDVIVKAMIERGRWSGETFLRHWQTEAAIPVSDEHFMIRDVNGDRILGMGTIIRDISEARRVSGMLRESEERFRLTIDEAPIGMALVALDGRFVRVNRALCDVVGYTAEELTKLTFRDITHPDDLEADVALAARLARGEIPRYQLEKRYLRKDGASVDITLSASILRDRDGAPLYYIAQVENITERKRAEDALRRSESEFRSLAESMPQIVWTTGADGLNTYFNQQWVDYTGLTLEQSYGEGWITPFHPDDRPRAWEAWQRATKHRDTYSLECRLRRADGVYRWWLIRGVPLLGANSEISKWFGTCTDIEHIKAAEQKLKESEAKYSGIISISADAIISIDDKHRINMFNQGAEQIFGYSKTEVIGMPLDNLIPERLRNTHRQHVAGFAAGDVTARRMGERLATIAGLRKNGQEFPAEAAISKLQVGDKILLTVALRDITERRRTEREQQFLAEAG
ncbi:MAG: PAS domain S-box protein, partial [Thermoanaerobaculia bacterium]